MQQLFQAFGVDWSLLIAQAVNFAIVLVALWYFLYKPVMTTLSRRQEIVAKGVQDAHDAKEILARADTEAEERARKADTEAERIVATARESADALAERLRKEAEDRAAAVEADAASKAAETLAKAHRESEKEVARLAILATEKLLKERHD